MTQMLAKKSMEKEGGMAKEVMQLLERVKEELALNLQERKKTKLGDPFKELLEFIESPLDHSTDGSHANKVFQVSDEDNYKCSECKMTFEKSVGLSIHMKKAHRSNNCNAVKQTNETETNLSSGKDLSIDNKKVEASSEEDDSDVWAEMPGGLYQCLVCLASGLTWERRQRVLASSSSSS